MTKKKVFVPEHIDENGIKVLDESGLAEPIYLDDRPVSEEEFFQILNEAHAILVRIIPVNARMIESAPHLQIIAKHGVGVDNIDVAAATDHKIPVTITPEGNSDAVAEQTLAMMLALARNLTRADADLKTGRFSRREHYTGVELGGKTLAIVGLGRIGSRVARKASLGFGMRVMAVDPYISKSYAEGLDVVLLDDLGALLEACRYITLHCPLTPETHNLIGENELRAMSEDAYLINTARGGIVDERALHRALSEHWIQGAALDVFVNEPPRPDDTALLELDSVLVTPHIAGSTQEAGKKLATMAAEEIVQVLAGRRPKNPVNPSIYHDAE
jgi:D-3-phosphoglycerate dehydrogenase